MLVRFVPVAAIAYNVPVAAIYNKNRNYYASRCTVLNCVLGNLGRIALITGAIGIMIMWEKCWCVCGGRGRGGCGVLSGTRGKEKCIWK